MKRIVLVASSVVMLLAGCVKNEVASRMELREGAEISISAYTGRQVTKATSAYTGAMKVSAFFTSGQVNYFDNTVFTYDAGSSRYFSSPVMYWPLRDDDPSVGVPIDFYAVSSTSGNYSVSTTDASNTAKTVVAGSSNPVNGADDLLSAVVTGKKYGDEVSIGFGHKLTKVSFKALGANTRLKYVITGITVKAMSQGTYTFGSSEGWSGHGGSKEYTFSVTNGSIGYNTSSSQVIGADGYGLMLIPQQPSASETVVAYVSFSVYERNTGGADVRVYHTTKPVDLTASAHSDWGINKSVVYSLVLPAGDDTSLIKFTGEVTEWGSEQRIDIPTYNALHFVSDGEQALQIKKHERGGGSLYNFQYSYDGESWVDVSINNTDSPEIPFVGNHLYVRGVGNSRLNNYMGTFLWGTPLIFGYMITFTTSAPVYCSGNIIHMMDYREEAVPKDGGRFAGLFLNCTQLVSAPDFPSDLLDGDGAYCFYGCTSLTVPPVLPADSVTSNAYAFMFSVCTSLNTPPDLPATHLNQFCYSYMFQNCTSLSAAPELPASVMFYGCYECMFRACTSLDVPPELPATQLNVYCYNHMFANCTSLKTAPDLPATELTDYCYLGMFSGCSSLTVIKELPATTLKTFCYNGMFTDCISLKTAPALPALSMATSCYQEMFQGCTSLESIPKLPATTLATSCYTNMFKGCTKIKMSLTSGSPYTNQFTFGAVPTSTYANDMFTGTGGSFTGTPTAQTLYTSNTIIQ